MQQASDFFNTNSPEMFINIPKEKLPPRNHPDFIQLAQAEREKCKYGVNINGQFIVPSLYYDLNFHTILYDALDSHGNEVRVKGKPQLRDNGWILHNDYYNAKQLKKGYVVGGARQIGKSDFIVSLTCRELFCFDNAEVLGLFSISSDKETFNKKFSLAISDADNFLVIPSIDKDLSQTEIRFGMTRKNNEPIILSRMFTYLTKAGKATEVGAGKSTTFFFFDEIAKEEMQGAWDAVKPALRSSFGGYRNPPLFAFTGGNVEKSKDAINLFMNPNANELLSFETEGSQTGKFMGGWYRGDFKNAVPLSDYLGLPLTTGSELSTIQIQVTDFDKANQVLDQEQEDARKASTPGVLAKHKMYNPRTLEEMSLSVQESPFKRYREQLKKHQQWLLETKPGKPANFFRDFTGEARYSFVDAVPVSNFPHKDTDDIENTPVMIYDDVKHKGVYHLHVGGLDPYNVGQTETSPSLGAFYLMRRHYGDTMDPFQDTMVASYVARPERVDTFHKKIKEVLDYYSGSMLHESSNDMVLEFFDKDFKAEQYLGKSWNLKAEISPQSSYKGAYGIPPTPAFQRAWMNRIVEYISEPIGISDAGEQVLGYTRLLDPMLIEEMLQWKPDMNVDRLVAFGHALLYCASLDKYDKPAVVKPVTAMEPEKRYNKPVWGISNSSRSLHTTRKPFGFK